MNPTISKDMDPAPTISLDEDDLAAIKTWEVGKTYSVEMKIKMKSKHQGGYMGSSDKAISATFEVLSVEEDSASEDKAETKPATKKPPMPPKPAPKAQNSYSPGMAKSFARAAKKST